jgi:hypothetical protein
MSPIGFPSFRPSLIRAVPLLALVLGLGVAHAAPTIGFREDFPGVSTSSWGGGAQFSNPGTGGVGGAGDGYLDVLTPSPANLGTNSFGTEFAGNWTTSGVTQVRVWLKDIGGTGNLEIHFGVGTSLNFWQDNDGLVPPTDRWAEYVIDLTNAAHFTQTHGTGTFAAALAGADRIHLRHDVAPYVFSPDPIAGEFGVDHLLLTNGTAGVEPLAAGARPVLLAPPYPNPARGRVSFALEGGGELPVTIRVLDVSGRLVRRVELAASSGPRTWVWNGTDDRGAVAPAGVYRAIATGAGGGSTRAFTMIR